MPHMILVTGAGGKTGKAVIKALIARGAPVRAFVRSFGHEAALRAIGVREVIAGAMDDAGSVSRAVKGADAIYHICPNVSPYEVAFAKVLIAAANELGVRRLVYHSVLHPQIEAMPHHWNKLRVEEMLFSSGLDNHHPAADRLHAKQPRRVGPHGQRRHLSGALSG
jgi:uncharacterized protein YbjT (DUF2867 family)